MATRRQKHIMKFSKHTQIDVNVHLEQAILELKK